MPGNGGVLRGEPRSSDRRTPEKVEMKDLGGLQMQLEKMEQDREKMMSEMKKQSCLRALEHVKEDKEVGNLPDLDSMPSVSMEKYN